MHHHNLFFEVFSNVYMFFRVPNRILFFSSYIAIHIKRFILIQNVVTDARGSRDLEWGVTADVILEQPLMILCVISYP